MAQVTLNAKTLAAAASVLTALSALCSGVAIDIDISTRAPEDRWTPAPIQRAFPRHYGPDDPVPWAESR